MAKLYRQGDILFKEISRVPRGKRNVRKNGVVAEGEATGHLHRVENTNKAEVFDVGKDLIVSSPKGIRILHDEHDPIKLPAGNFEVVRQREHTQFGSSRVVAD